MTQGMDFCDLVTALRPYFFPKDRDITLQDERGVIIPWPVPLPDPPPEDPPPVISPCGQIPIGGIIGWSGALVDIPTCWQLCDGTNGTPESRNVFIMGAGDTYNPGDTGGAATVDISHQHAKGTLAADNESAHTHEDGTYAAANDTHSHDDGSYATATSGSHTHGGATGSDGDHNHTYSDTSTVPSSFTSLGSSGTTVGDQNHTHFVTGTTSAEGSHTHTVFAEGSIHSHDVTGTSANDTHGHDVTGTSAAGSAHGHTISGTSATGGSVALNVINPYVAWGWMQRMS